MSDLVKRLYDADQNSMQRINGSRIEALEAALRRIADSDPIDVSCLHSNHNHNCRGIARAALGESHD